MFGLEWVAVAGIILAAWSVTGNDLPVQILGTWMESNRNKVRMIWLFLAATTVFLCTLWFGWYMNDGDISFGRLDKIPYTEPQWYHVAAVGCLILLTLVGIPVSTSFLVLSAFASSIVMEKVLLKSMFGYAFAAVTAYCAWILIARYLDERNPIKPEHEGFWYTAQWISTMALLYAWLTHDIANFAVFLPRQVPWDVNLFLSGVIVIGMAYMFWNQGARIRQIVKEKKHTTYVRSATLIDAFYFFVLVVFKYWPIFGKLPLSTTWVFVGLLCGRELAIASMSNGSYKVKSVFPVVRKDFLRLLLGLAVSVLLILCIQHFAPLLEG